MSTNSAQATSQNQDLVFTDQEALAVWRVDPSDVGPTEADPFVVAADNLMRAATHWPRGPNPGTRCAAYVVSSGRAMGVYTSWEVASAAVDGYPGNCVRGYPTLEAARDAWDLILATGLWGKNRRKPGGAARLEPFDGYIVGDEDDVHAAALRKRATRLADFVSMHPNSIRPPIDITKLNLDTTSEPTHRSPPDTPARKEKAKEPSTPPFNNRPVSSVTDSTAKKTARPRESQRPSPLSYNAVPLTPPVPQNSTVHGKQEVHHKHRAPNAQPLPVNSTAREPAAGATTTGMHDLRCPPSLERTGYAYDAPHALPTDRPPVRALTEEETWFVVIRGARPGTYLGRSNTTAALGTSPLSHFIMCANERHANRAFQAAFNNGDVRKL